MRRFMSKQPMQSFHLERFLKHAHADTLQQELHKAVTYVTAQAARDDWKTPLGKAAALSKPDDVTRAMSGPHGAAAVAPATSSWTPSRTCLARPRGCR